MSADTVIGVLLGSAVTVAVTYLNHRFTWERERHRIESEYEDKAISQVFSPLVFHLQRSRSLLAKLTALRETFKRVSKMEEKKLDIIPVILELVAESSRSIPKALENLLIHNAALIQPSQFYIDLGVLESYLSTTVDFIGLARNEKHTEKLAQYFVAMTPLLVQLEEAIGLMRKYAMTRAAKLPKYEYQQFFTEKKHSELEAYLDEANRILLGEGIRGWSAVLQGTEENGKHK